MRQALNYCIDGDGLVTFLNGTAEPAVGWLKASDPHFGAPQNRYRLDPGRAGRCSPRPASPTRSRSPSR